MSPALAVLAVFCGLLFVLWVHDLQAQWRKQRRASEALHNRRRIGL